MPKRRKKVDKQFKLEAVRLSQESDSIRDVARDLGIHINTLYRWRAELLEPDSSTPVIEKAKPKKTAKDAEISLLRKQLADKNLELEILKKAIGIFSKKDGRSINS